MKNWKDIEIHPYDKGKGFIVDTKENCAMRVESELNNPVYYEQCNVSSSTEMENINRKIQDWVDKWVEKNELSEKLGIWLVNTEAKPGAVYQNYKAHKPPLYPGRTITSGCGGPTERLAKWIELHLSKVLKFLKYRIQDTSQLLRELDMLNDSCKLEGKTILHVTWDITAMYPNIDNVRGLESCRKALRERNTEPLGSDDYIHEDCIMEAIELCLYNNVTEFRQKVYRQTKGTAMGPSHACSYADIARHYLVDEKINSDLNPHHSKIILWSGYRDDVYTPFIGSVEEAKEVDEYLNNCDPDLKFVMNPKEPSTEAVEYLDLSIFTDAQNKIATKIYSKSCDPHAYLLPTSCHPTHICNVATFLSLSLLE